MLKIETRKIEKAFSKAVIPFVSSFGCDTATRTGWCKAVSDPDHVTFDYGFISLPKEEHFRYSRFIEIFKSILSEVPKDTIIIIEECFYKNNAKTLKLLSRLGGFAYSIAYLSGFRNLRFVSAVSARSHLNIKKRKKEDVHMEFLRRLGLELDDEDIIDAMVLALNGILEDNKLPIGGEK